MVANGDFYSLYGGFRFWTREAPLLLIEKIDALLNGVTRNDVEHLRPAQRQRLAFVLRAIADMADPPTSRRATREELRKSGVLSQLPADS